MLYPTTLRVEKELLNRVEKFAVKQGLDKAAFFRSLLLKGFQQTFQEYILEEYSKGNLSWGEAASELDMDRYQFLEFLGKSSKNLNVTLADVLGEKS